MIFVLTQSGWSNQRFDDQRDLTESVRDRMLEDGSQTRELVSHDIYEKGNTTKGEMEIDLE